MKNGKSNISLCSLASGSVGNSIYIENTTAKILIDAGLSGIEIERRMESKSLTFDDMKGIVISHEHNDHLMGAAILSRRFDIPLYMSRLTYQRVAHKIGEVKNLKIFEPGVSFYIGDFEVHPFQISHDAVDPVGFSVTYKDSKVGIATDLGIATGMVKTHLKDSNMLFIEANHDPEMLINGSYPWSLKQRIRSRHGHLSNFDTRELLVDLKHENLRNVVLGHLSEENNTPDKVLETCGDVFNIDKTSIHLALQSGAGDLIEV
ncbi:MAG: MBL fold metallo-hydrolase [Desulfobacterales bacterium]|nr:MBL fold metallo-hydrolase [Desulfobacterales bacterium]